MVFELNYRGGSNLLRDLTKNIIEIIHHDEEIQPADSKHNANMPAPDY